jgi:site-specific recombinase XerD
MARHTFATTICLNNGMPMEDVSKLLGHSSLKTTAIYGRITKERLQKSMDKVNKKI